MSEADPSSRRRLGIAIVVILLLVDAALIFLIVRPEEPPTTVADVGGPVAPSSTTSTTPTTSPTVSPTATPTPTPSKRPATVVETREIPLSVLTADVALRATPGSCPDGEGRVLQTTNGGARWTALDIPESAAVLRVRAAKSTDFWFIGTAAADCSPTFVRSTDGGDSWDADDDTSGAWHLLADPESGRLHAPDGAADSPCTDSMIVELEGVSSQVAYALCADGSLHRTGNAGQKWQPAGSAPGALAMGVAGSSVVVAAGGVAGCDGLAVQAVTADETDLQTCVKGAEAVDVGLSFADADLAYLIAGEDTWTTDDGGNSWSQA